jgi:hypothetical protein
VEKRNQIKELPDQHDTFLNNALIEKVHIFLAIE